MADKTNMQQEKPTYTFTSDMRAGKLREGICFQSTGKAIVNSEEISYHTDAQDYIFLDEDGTEEASAFVISQFRDGGEAQRPVLFVINGGPGMSMADMYVTMYGPKLLDTGDVDECRITAPYNIIENNDWLIDVCDIVLIDPVGTGYGRLINEKAAGKFYSVEGDAYALTKVIKYWITKYHRWNSPKYFNGVSYGGVRCATVTQFLMGGALHASQQINGIVLTV